MTVRKFDGFPWTNGLPMKVDIERKWLSVFGHTPKGEGCWFFAFSVFRHRWEFGFACDWIETEDTMTRSSYYVYTTRFNSEGLRNKHYEFPRKTRWSHVTN